MTKSARKGKVTPPGADAAPEVGPELDDAGQLPVSFHCLAVEGMPTSDRRTIAANALEHRALPISILAQWTNPGQEGGHAGAEVIGHLTDMWRKPGPEVQSLQTGQPFPDGTFVWQGRGVVDPTTHGGDLVAKGHLRGNSVDLSEVDFTEELAADDKPSVTISGGKIAATTLCPIPAFADAYVEVGEAEDLAATAGAPEPVAVAALVAAAHADGFADYTALTLPPFRSAELGDECGPCLAAIEGDEWVTTTRADGQQQFAPTAAKRRRAFARGLAMKGDKADGSDAQYPIENQADLDKAVHMVGLGGKADATIHAHIRRAARRLGLKLPQTLKADAAPTLPPLSIFADPGLAEYTPITVGEPREDGRREIVGHIAPWNECHVGYSGQCVRAPHSYTDYARFATGAARCVDADGQTRIAAVGHISMSRDPASGGHAPGDLAEAQAVAFYDNHCTAAADVAAGEDAHGIWIHGLTVPDLSEAEVDRLLASPPSGDWRAYRGNLELCAILSVNSPGYVVPRARVASGEPVSLVAAGVPAAPMPRRAHDPQAATSDTVRAAVRAELEAAGLVTRQQRDTTGDTTVVSLADRKSAALLALRKGAALAVMADPKA
jgi:hypothetical protein